MYGEEMSNIDKLVQELETLTAKRKKVKDEIRQLLSKQMPQFGLAKYISAEDIIQQITLND